MTNKEAIEILKPLTEYSVNENGIGTFPMVSTPLQAEALDLAIKALEEDIDAYEQGYTDGWKERFGEPNERPQGEWLHKEFDPFLKEYGQCSNCLQRERVGNFCRNCGADMRTKKIQVPSCLTNQERHEELLERYKEE